MVVLAEGEAADRYGEPAEDGGLDWGQVVVIAVDVPRHPEQTGQQDQSVGRIRLFLWCHIIMYMRPFILIKMDDM